MFSLCLASCVTTTPGTADDDPRVISQQEIQAIGDIGDAYTLVQHYEPSWLETRGQGSLRQPNEVVVYLENSRQGGPESLRQFSVINIQKIEFLPPAEANMKFGSGHANGAIMVSLKEGKNPGSR
jgi:hypothetical protein